MALAAGDFVMDKGSLTYLGPGSKMISGTWTLPASYTNGGEVLTNAILAAKFGFKKIRQLIFTPTGGVDAAFDAGAASAGNQGKLHVYQSGIQAHTHDITAIGGLTSSEALFLDASQKFGKNAATNRTIVGSTSATTGGVAPVTAANTATEVVAGQNLASSTIKFMAWGE